MKDTILTLTTEIFEGLDTTKYDALGIADGQKIISEFLKAHEFGLAFEQLSYIISECEISLDSRQRETFELLQKKLTTQ